jgi:hypothetical protein
LECLHLSPEGGPLSKISLALATSNLNSRLRKGGISAREIFTQRDQLTGEQLPISDRQLILEQHITRVNNHHYSSVSKAHGKLKTDNVKHQIGDLVFLKGEKDKTHARDKYMVTGLTDTQCQLRKFTRSQFRSKTYTVRHSDCYSVMPTVLTMSPTGPIRGLRIEDNILPTNNGYNVCPTTPGIPIRVDNPQFVLPVCDIQPGGIVPPPTQPVDDLVAVPEPPIDPDDHPPRRSTRCKVQPSWQTTGQWVMDS